MSLFIKPIKASDPANLVVRTPERLIRPHRDGPSWLVTAKDGLSKKILLSQGWKLVKDGEHPTKAAPKAPKASKVVKATPTITSAAPEAPEPTVEAIEAPETSEPVGRTLAEVFDEADLSVLDDSVKKIKRSLATGKHDDCLDDLLAAEESGNTRKSAVDAITDRMEKIA